MKIVTMTLFKAKDKYMVSSQEGIYIGTCICMCVFEVKKNKDGKTREQFTGQMM